MFHVRLTLPPPKVVDRWNEKRAMFGVYDNIGILGKIRFRGTEFQSNFLRKIIFFSPHQCTNGTMLSNKSRHLTCVFWLFLTLFLVHYMY